MARTSREPAGSRNNTAGHEVVDTRALVVMLIAAGVGVLLYAIPPVGMAVLGAITALAALAPMIRR